MLASIVIGLRDINTDEWVGLVILAFAVLQELGLWIFSRMALRHRFFYPIDLELMQDRWGIWVMIVVSSPENNEI